MPTSHEQSITVPAEQATGASLEHGEPDLTWQEHLAIGDRAYADAVEIEEDQGLDKALPYYERASKHLLAVTMTGPLLNEGKINAEPEPADPVRLLKVAGSLAKQAQMTDEHEQYSTVSSQNVNIKANKQRIAAETLQRASQLLMGTEIAADQSAMIAEFDVETPAEAVVFGAVEAAKETGTTHYVSSPDALVDESTPERLENEGKEAVAKFIGEHALESGPQGAEFVARTAELVVEAVEDMTGEHKLPLPLAA
ncbi:MAG TPA: hypothetical protein VHC21_01195 [Candidatus Saccharimonadales bacterium]|nr:hypothetical protein [Candidatus Saccharimonadales bacterium]